MSKWIITALVAYTLAGIVTFGHFFTRHPQSLRGEYDSTFTANGAALAAMFWPLYLSAEAWKLTAP